MDEHDEGLARNIHKLGGWGSTFDGIAGRKLKTVLAQGGKDEDDEHADQTLTLTFLEGPKVVFGVEGDCCSRSWIEHLEAPDSVVGREVVDIFDDRLYQEENGDLDLLQVYHTKFRLDNGETITLEYRNESNGYYGVIWCGGRHEQQ